MRRTLFMATIVFLASPWCLAAGAVAESREAFRLERIGRPAGGPSVSRPAAGALPRALELEVPDVEPGGDVDPLATEDAADRMLETRAAVAATWTARQRFEHLGRREVYGAGFHDGLKTALEDPMLGLWDYRQGVRAGRTDPQAVLSEPRLVEVFDQYPLRSARDLDGEPPPDPWRLYRASGYDAFYRRDWTDPGKAYDYWLAHHHNRAFWLALGDADRARFERLFTGMFPRQLKEVASGASERAYGQGYDAGWDYGALVAREWRYRQGYHEGIETARRDRAEAVLSDRAQATLEDREPALYDAGLSSP